MIRWVSAPGGQERDFILGLPGPGPWSPAAEATLNCLYCTVQYRLGGQDQIGLGLDQCQSTRSSF